LEREISAELLQKRRSAEKEEKILFFSEKTSELLKSLLDAK
jgi:hypothetical protein